VDLRSHPEVPLKRRCKVCNASTSGAGCRVCDGKRRRRFCQPPAPLPPAPPKPPAVDTTYDAEWFLDADHGDDGNLGTTPGSALRTPAELQRRIETFGATAQTVRVVCTFTCHDDAPKAETKTEHDPTS
jgi:hypothetical protein